MAAFELVPGWEHHTPEEAFLAIIDKAIGEAQYQGRILQPRRLPALLAAALRPVTPPDPAQRAAKRG